MKNTTLKAKFNSAFSLVELLVVIAVIAVIAAIAIPNITGVREAAVGAQTKYNNESGTNFINQVKALGLTNATGGSPTTIADLTNASGAAVQFIGTVNGTNVSMTWTP